jgi:Uma2 family endonuclease
MAVSPKAIEAQSPRRIFYPTSDGKPMGETQQHVRLIAYSTEALDTQFRHRPDVYIAGNNFVYYEEGNSKARLSPDTYVVFGVPKRDRESYMAWMEGGKLPDVVFEFTSRATRHEDTSKKFAIYEQIWCAAEYFLFDPRGDYLSPPLQGYHLWNGVYAPIPLRDERLHSNLLGLDISWKGARIKFYDSEAQAWFGTHRENQERAEFALRRAEAEAQRRADAEAEVERLRAEIEALKRRQT